MHLVVFESSHWADLAPFTLTRPACLLRCGATTLLEKHIRAFQPTEVTLWVRDELVDVARREAAPLVNVPLHINRPLGAEAVCMVNGASILPDPIDNGDYIPLSRPAWTDTLAAIVTAPGLTHTDALQPTFAWDDGVHSATEVLANVQRVRHWGDLVDQNVASLRADASHWNDPAPAATCINPADVHARPGVSIGPNVVLDASKGPILLDHDCYIGANSVLEGPCYVGPHSRITPLSLIRAGTSIGPVCRVGGEVSNTIFQAYSNKSHDGFIGDSYIGAWVNCGAGTTTSNLKSTYGPVSVTLGSRRIATERATLGAAIGDHAKLATYARLAAGAYVGVASVVSLSDRMPAFTPSFRFIDDRGDELLDPVKAEEITQRMMARRDVALSDEDRALFAYARLAAEEIEG